MKYQSISGFRIPEDASAEDLEELKKNLILTNEEREFIGNPVRPHLLKLNSRQKFKWHVHFSTVPFNLY